MYPDPGTNWCMQNETEDSVYNFKIGKQLAIRCSSHPQGKSEARCQNMHLFPFKDTHDQRVPAPP